MVSSEDLSKRGRLKGAYSELYEVRAFMMIISLEALRQLLFLMPPLLFMLF